MKLTKLLIPTLLLSVPLALAQQVTPPPIADSPDSEFVGNPAEPGLPDEVPLDAPPAPDSELITTTPVGAPTLPSGDVLEDVPPPPPPPEDGPAIDAAAEPVANPIEASEGGFLIRDASLNDIFQMLAKKGGKQYFHNARIAGPEFNVSGHLNGGDPLQQMEELAFQYGLTLYEKGSTVYALNNEQLGQLPASEWHYQLAYLRPTDMEQIKALITPILSPGTGIVNYEPKTNTVIIIDSAHHVERAKEFLTSIDKPKGQITVEIKILRVKSAAGEKTGIRWDDLGLNDGVPVGVSASLAGIFGLGTPGSGFADSNVVLNDVAINGVLQALAAGGLVKQLSNPTLITEDNEESNISLIDRIPIFTTTVTNVGNGLATEETEVRYKIDEEDPVGDPATTREIGVTVAVTPTLLPDGTIRMKMRPRSAEVSEWIEKGDDQYPRVSEAAIETIARIPDGHSLLIGGFYGEAERKDETKVPLLGDIPVINFFFKSKETLKETTSLVFVVTPTSYNPEVVYETCKTSHRLRDKMSLGPEHGWTDDANPGVAHVPDLDRTLRAMDPRRDQYREPVENYQVDLENCEDCGPAPKAAKRPVRRRR